LEIGDIFKDKDKKEGDSVTDLILAVLVVLLRRDMDGLARVVQEALELVEL
jgi:hypothetical protein